MKYDRNSNIVSIKEAIKGFVKETHLENKFNEHMLLDIWKSAMGNAIVSRTKKLYLHSGTLFVQVDSAPLRNKLHFEKAKLINLLNSKLDKPLIEDVVVR
ncbi:MAG: DUF721 domain-containing protein [Bacteroidota bacterium]